LSKTFAIGDTHFNHKNILKPECEPIRKKLLGCETVEEMNQKIIERWNDVVGKNDLVYHLGDFSFGVFDARQLNGHKILILGNHDRSADRMLDAGFVECLPWAEVEWNKHILLSHCPFEKLPKNYYQIHGHIHSKPAPTEKHFCVSIEHLPNGQPIDLRVIMKQWKLI